MNTRDETAGQRLARVRTQLGWTQERLALAMGLPKRAGQIKVTRWETGTVRLTADDLERAARAMGLPPYALQEPAEIDRLLRWVEAAAHRAASHPAEATDPFVTATLAVFEAFGPAPDPGDAPAWEAYLARLRRVLVQHQEESTAGTVPTAPPVAPADGKSAS